MISNPCNISIKYLMIFVNSLLVLISRRIFLFGFETLHSGIFECIQSGPKESMHIDFLFCLGLKAYMLGHVEFAMEEDTFWLHVLIFAYNPLARECHNPKLLNGILGRVIYHVRSHKIIFLMIPLFIEI